MWHNDDEDFWSDSAQNIYNLCLSGTGSFGKVVLAQHRPSKEFFALKMMEISEVIRLKQVDHVMSEKAILQIVNHPFLIQM